VSTKRPWWLVAVLATLIAIPLLVAPAFAAAANTVTVFYQPSSAWSSVNIHYAPTGGSWTTVPGVAMGAASCAGWYTTDIALGTATGMQATFTNGTGAKGDLRVYVLARPGNTAPGKVGTDGPYLR
jgi:carbohydrate binding protein with CBM25 domain